MATTKDNHKSMAGKEEAPLVGTWISVGVVGLVILATYIVLFGLFMDRV
jgi:hypothetical protein